jgi:uncharacterized protein YecA (UPF0149 family)
MKIMAGLLRQGRFADEIMQMHTALDARHRTAATKVGRNDPCPCGSEKKFKQCHGRTAGSAVLQ